MRSFTKSLFLVALAVPVMAFIAECVVGPEFGVDAGVFRYLGWVMSTGGELYRTVGIIRGQYCFCPSFWGI